MRFSKLHAAGIDIIAIDSINETQPHLPSALSRAICNRHFGAGADGMVAIERSTRGDFRAGVYSSDGQDRGPEPIPLCCAAAFAAARGIVRHSQLRVEAGPHLHYLTVPATKRRATTVRIDLGQPNLQAARIPTTLPGNPPVEVPVTFPDTMHNVTAIGLSTPFAVIFVRELSDALVNGVGRQMETHPGFPERTNVAFVKINKPDDVTVRVWERDLGEARISGTGAGAISVAGGLTGRTKRSLTVHFAEGQVDAEWDQNDNHVYMTCAVQEVYQGDWPERI